MTYKQSEISDCIPTPIGSGCGVVQGHEFILARIHTTQLHIFLIFIYLAESGLSWWHTGSFIVAHGP